MPKTILSFYCDDTNPFVAPAAAFKAFLEFVAAEGIAGESSFIPAYDCYGFPKPGLTGRPSDENQKAYAELLPRAYACGVDTHFELMTHGGLFDFLSSKTPPHAVHEGLWLREPAVTLQEYEAYFGNIITEAERIGVRFTGVTEPGCGCEACLPRQAELNRLGAPTINPNAWQALLNLARQGRFRGKTVPCFIGNGKEECSARLMASADGCGVYDLSPNLADKFGLWLNDPGKVDPDYYITADGNAGGIVEQVAKGAPYCLFYCHWQGLNPANGVGWPAFKEVVARVKKHLRGRVLWQRPRDYTDQLLAAR